MSRDGKKIVTWKFRDDGRSVDADAYMRTVYHGTSPRTEFRVRLPELNIDLSDSDLDKLRLAVFAAIREHDATTWAKHLHVTVKARRADALGYGGTAEVSVEIEPWELGTTSDGRQLKRQLHGYSQRPTVDWPEVGTFTDYDPRTCALLPDTPANRRALQSIAEAFDALHGRLAALLAPDMIAATLRAIGAIGAPRMLEAGAGEHAASAAKLAAAKPKRKRKPAAGAKR